MLTVTDILSYEKLGHAFDYHCSQVTYRYNPPLWELADTSVAGDPEGALSLMTPGTVWACSLCVQWDDRGDKIKVHLMEM